ncbi:MAG: helix-turn-helix transcriptional regulator, partial [Eggerthellales bacterium]|nr:helix-turn-helix transcriptional regulator [Eggerthellales bacterium]
LVSLLDLPFGVELFLSLAISALLYAARAALPAFEPIPNGSLRGTNISLALLVLLIGLAELLRVVLTGLFSEGEERVIVFSLATQLACPVVFAAVMAICLGPRARGDVGAPARFLLPLLMLGYMSLLLYSNSWVAYAILGAGYWCLYCLTWLFAGDLARCSKAPLLPFALVEGGIGFVAFIVLLVTNACGVDGSALVPSVVLSVLAAAVILALLPGGFARRQTSSPKDDGAGWAEDAHATLSDQGQVKVECDPVALLSAACGLSPREVEVMALLARGRSTPYIQDRLGIAFGTAQAHVRHVYEKTGVHSRQELLDLIESVAENGQVSAR